MRSAILLTFQTITVGFGALLLGWWLHRRFRRAGVAGALAFVGSQAVRPLLIGLTIAAGPFFAGIDPETAFWSNFAILTTTSGPFEETARYVVLRYVARHVRRWRDGVMFGAGHGGTDAILIFGFGLFSSLTLPLTGDALIAQLQLTAPDQVSALPAQIGAVGSIQRYADIRQTERALTLLSALSVYVIVRARGGDGTPVAAEEAR